MCTCPYRCHLLTKHQLQTSPSPCPPPERSPPFPALIQRGSGSTHLSRCFGMPCCGKGPFKLPSLLFSPVHYQSHAGKVMFVVIVLVVFYYCRDFVAVNLWELRKLATNCNPDLFIYNSSRSASF